MVQASPHLLRPQLLRLVKCPVPHLLRGRSQSVRFRKRSELQRHVMCILQLGLLHVPFSRGFRHFHHNRTRQSQYYSIAREEEARQQQ